METRTIEQPAAVKAGPSLNRAYASFRSAAVLGAGTMGAQIAAHLANAGMQVLLLDVPSSGTDRNEAARKGLQRARKQRPDPFFSSQSHEHIAVGNFEDDLERLSEHDWLIEAVVERADVKRGLLQRIAPYVSASTVISTNTSGIPVSELADALPVDLRARFLGTHFFNPPRYLKLLEVIPTPETDQEVLEHVQRFARIHLGKGVVIANDRPYFVANRIGVYAMIRAMRHFLSGAFTIEEIDHLTGPMIGRPRSATFRTADVVGLDVLLEVLRGMETRLADDEARSDFSPPPLLEALVANGATGAKAGAGFYRKDPDGLKRIDPGKKEYVPVQGHDLDLQSVEAARDVRERLQKAYEHEGRAGDFVRTITLETLAYAARRVPEVARSPADVDNAMKWGFGWELGPFEQWETLGFKRVLHDMGDRGMHVPEWIEEVAREHGSIYRKRGDAVAVFIPDTSTLEEIERPRDVIALGGIRSDARAVLWENSEAALLDIGDAVALFEFRSKGNTLSRAVMKGLVEAIGVVEADGDLRGLVIGNDGKNFSVGANLAEMAGAVLAGRFSDIDDYLQSFQEAIQGVHYSSKPIAVCTHQRVLGGACELVMACLNPVAAAESYIGLVEVGVGLIPAGTGLMRLARLAAERSPNQFPSQVQPYLQKYFEQVARATVSASAVDAVEMGYLNGSPTIVMNEERRIFAAREQVVRLSNIGYRPPVRGRSIYVLGRPTRAAFEVAVDQYRQGGFMSEYDAHIANKLAYVITGGSLTSPQEVSEEYLLDLEREGFLELLGERRTQDRIDHMLKNKKPLRN